MESNLNEANVMANSSLSKKIGRPKGQKDKLKRYRRTKLEIEQSQQTNNVVDANADAK